MFSDIFDMQNYLYSSQGFKPITLEQQNTNTKDQDNVLLPAYTPEGLKIIQLCAWYGQTNSFCKNSTLRSRLLKYLDLTRKEQTRFTHLLYHSHY